MIALAATSWGTTGAVTTVLVAQAQASPLLIGVARLWLAAVLLAGGARLVTGTLAVARPDRVRCLVLGACMAVFQAAYFTAVTLSGIAVTALVAICSAPILIAALAGPLLGERPTRGTWRALALGVTGTALLVAGRGGAVTTAPGFLAGALLALVAGLAYALYAVLAKAALARTAPLPLAAATFTAAALLLTPVLAWTDAPLRQVALGWPWLLYLGAVATGGAYALYTTGLRHVPASTAGVVALLEPLTATLLGVAAFGERLGAAGAVGGLLLLAGIGLLLAARPRVTGAP
jgi:DME family drug/metabolite transporter